MEAHYASFFYVLNQHFLNKSVEKVEKDRVRRVDLSIFNACICHIKFLLNIFYSFLILSYLNPISFIENFDDPYSFVVLIVRFVLMIGIEALQLVEVRDALSLFNEVENILDRSIEIVTVKTF